MRKPNGYGSIVKLSGKRRKPFLVRAAAVEVYNADTGTITVERPQIGTFATRREADMALALYNHDPYDLKADKLTFADVYEMYFEEKYINGKKKYSTASINSTKAAYKNCSVLHKKKFAEIRKVHMQAVIDQCPLKHSSLELIQNLFRQMYKFAMQNDFVQKDYSQFVTINIPDDDEKGVPFTEDELIALWKHKDVPGVDTILIMIYSGYRISAFTNIQINLSKQYFQGGVKTSVGKDRIVPIHSSILPMVATYKGDTWLKSDTTTYRKKVFYPILEELGLSISPQGTKHTPHDCRHTFSWLCDKYHIDDMSKHLLMGHKLGGDVEANVYGHRTIEELRAEIEKISIPKF